MYLLIKIHLLDFSLCHVSQFRLLTPQLQFFTGQKQKRKGFGPLIDLEHATTFMIPEGKLESEVDIHHFLHNVPFHELYVK